MGEYVRIAKTQDVPKNSMKLFPVEDIYEILVVNVDGEFYAVENQCPHMGYSLYLGTLEGKTLTCGFHQAKFDVTTGKPLGEVTHNPLQTFKVKIEDSWILIKLPSDGKPTTSDVS